MTISPKGLDFIRQYEGFELEAYLDSVGIWTIGYGNTMYEDGRKVKKDDIINRQRADLLFIYWVTKFSDQVNKLVKAPVTQNQFDALVALAYNIGIGAFTGSTALRRVNKNPSDLTVASAFLMWTKGTIKGKKQVIPGLVNRRNAEIKLYYS